MFVWVYPAGLDRAMTLLRIALRHSISFLDLHLHLYSPLASSRSPPRGREACASAPDWLAACREGLLYARRVAFVISEQGYCTQAGWGPHLIQFRSHVTFHA